MSIICSSHAGHTHAKCTAQSLTCMDALTSFSAVCTRRSHALTQLCSSAGPAAVSQHLAAHRKPVVRRIPGGSGHQRRWPGLIPQIVSLSAASAYVLTRHPPSLACLLSASDAGNSFPLNQPCPPWPVVGRWREEGGGVGKAAAPLLTATARGLPLPAQLAFRSPSARSSACCIVLRQDRLVIGSQNCGLPTLVDGLCTRARECES